jgi:hypothetical protein
VIESADDDTTKDKEEGKSSLGMMMLWNKSWRESQQANIDTGRKQKRTVLNRNR